VLVGGSDSNYSAPDEWTSFPRREEHRFKEPADLAELRFKRFDEAWKRADSRIKVGSFGLLYSIHAHTFNISQTALDATHAAALTRISTFVATPPPSGPFTTLPTLLITTRSPAPSSYLPPVLDRLRPSSLCAVLQPRDCNDLKASLTTLAKAFIEATTKFFGSETSAANPTEEDEEDDPAVYLHVAKRSKGEARIPEWDPAWLVSWYRELCSLSTKRGIAVPPPTVLLPSLPSHTALPLLFHTLHSLKSTNGIPFRVLLFSTASELHELLPFRTLKLLEVSREKMGGSGEGVWAGFLGVSLVGPAGELSVEPEVENLEVGIGRRAMGYLAGRAVDWEGGAGGIAAGLKVRFEESTG